jgi:transposase
VARRRQLTAMRTEELNRLRTAHLPRVQTSIQRVIRTLERQLAGLDDEMDRTLRRSPHWAAVAAVLTSVPGIGDQTARTLIAELPELGTLSRQRVAALAGLAPFNNDSGRFRGARSIRGGRAPVRTALYMATLVAARYNPTVRRWYQHLLARGKARKVALVACMRKLLTALNTMVREGRHWKEHPLCPAI